MKASESNPLKIALNRFNENPLLAPLPKQKSVLELALALNFQPITPINVCGIDLTDRLQLINEYKKIYVPTTQSINIARSLQQMIYDGLAQRDPRHLSSKTFIYRGSQFKGDDISKLEWWPSFASGMIIEGITGTGKSQLVDRFLSLFPQVVEHEENLDGGWRSLKQLVWLKIHMPSDGTRGGFLENAFRELDRVLRTEYTKQFSSPRWRIEKMLVVFLHLLSIHRCGLLIIEEAQEKNLSQSIISREFITFFLRLLNWGIPTVLIGNPLAFTKLREFSQDVDRFSDGGWFHIHPQMDPKSEDWTKGWLPSLWLPTLLNQKDADYVPISLDPIDSTLAGFVWRRTAGVPRYICRLRREVQDVALRHDAIQVTASMVDEVYRNSEKMVVLHERINAFINQDWKALRRFDDVPWDYFRQLWNPHSKAEDEPKENPVGPEAEDPLGSRESKAKTPRKPRATKANPIPKQPQSAAEVNAKKFQDSMSQEIAAASRVHKNLMEAK